MFKLESIVKSEFLKNTLTLMTGTTIAQVIPIITTPIITRIYLPQDFGVLGIYLSISAIIGILGTLSYPSAILITANDEDAISIVQLCIISVLIWTGIIGISILFLNSIIANLFKAPEAAQFFYFLPLSSLATGLGTIFSAWANRNKYYHAVSISRVVAAVLNAICSIILGLAIGGSKGLIYALILNQMTIPLILITYSTKKRSLIFKFHKWSMLRKQALLNKKFPQFAFPAELLNSFMNQLPIYFLSAFAGKSEVGYFNLSNRILGLPITFIGSAISDVFRQRASSDFAKTGNCYYIFIKTFRTLAKTSIVPFSILAIFAPQIFSLAFGPIWHEAGVYTRYLCIFYLLRFIISPLSYLFYIGGRQIEDLILNGYLFITSYLILTYFLKKTIYLALLVYSINYSLVYFYVFFRTLKMSKGNSINKSKTIREISESSLTKP